MADTALSNANVIYPGPDDMSQYFNVSYSLCSDNSQAYAIGNDWVSNENAVDEVRKIVTHDDGSATDVSTVYTKTYNIIFTATRNMYVYFDFCFTGTGDTVDIAMNNQSLKKSEIRLLRADKTLFVIDTNDYTVGEFISGISSDLGFYINVGDTFTVRHDIKFVDVDDTDYGWYNNLYNRFTLYVDQDYSGDFQNYVREDTRYLDADGLTQLCNLVGSDINSLKNENEEDKYCSYTSVLLGSLKKSGTLSTTIENISKYKFFKFTAFVRAGSKSDGSDITYIWPSMDEQRYIPFFKPAATTSSTFLSMNTLAPVIRVVQDNAVDISFLSNISASFYISKYDTNTDSALLKLSFSENSEYTNVSAITIYFYGIY